MPESIELTLAHSPDPDDAFMWWPLVGLEQSGPRIDTAGFKFELIMDDIESLNQQAESRRYDVTAVSVAQYPRIRSDYIFTACGASIGDGYGPKLIAPSGTTLDSIRTRMPVIAVPGERTTALACARLMLGPAMRWEAMAFDQIEDAVESGSYEAGVVIHEGQLTCESRGFVILADLGAWWRDTRHLILPLGGNVAARDLEKRVGPGTLARLSRVLRDSVAYAMANRAESLAWALQFGRGINAAQADQFVEMYVNSWTLDFGDDGQMAVQRFLDEAHHARLVPSPGMVDFAKPETAGESEVDCGATV